jgi:hypothetical protein
MNNLNKAFQELAQYATPLFEFSTVLIQDLSRGETTASALEAKLDGIEGRIDQLLASMEENLKENPTASDSS